jgi:putative hemolysin
MELIFIFVLSIVLSAFFSASEMAFVSSDQLKFKEKAEGGSKAAQTILNFHQRSEHFLTTILIGNNIVNVVSTSTMTYFLSVYAGVGSEQHGELIVAFIMTPILLIFAEMLPKDFARLNPSRYLYIFLGPLVWVSKLFHGATFIVLKFVDFVLKPIGLDHDKNFFVSEAEFRAMIEESIKSGVVSSDEKKLIDTILDFEKLRVKSAMTPVASVPKIDIHANVKDVKAIAKETKSRMLLVYEEIPSIIVGMIYVFDLLFEEDQEKGLSTFLRSPVFISETTSNERAFLTLQQRRQSYAVVIDGQNEVVGSVAIERLLLK